MNVLGLKTDLSKKNIIDLKNVNGLIKLDNINNTTCNCENVYVNKNSSYLQNNLNVEILTVEILSIDQKEFNLSKMECDDSSIIFISFMSNLLINLNINGIVSPINHKVCVSHSFIHKGCNYDIDTYPINLDLALIDNQIYFAITYAFIDDRPKFYFGEDTKKSNVLKTEHKNIDYRYIDINKEFM